LPPIGRPDQLVRFYSLKRDMLVAIATEKPEDAASGAASDAGNATDPAAVPEAYRNAPPIYDPSAGRPASAGPASDSGRRPQP
jgi:cytoskeleton protein RodZ